VVLRDTDKKGLRLRITKAGGKHWQFETRLRSGKLFTRSLGEWPTVSLDEARAEAHTLRGMTEQGIDPREVEQSLQAADAEAARQKAEAAAAREAAAAAKAEAARQAAVTVGEAWAVYLQERRPLWGDRHYADHLALAKPGGKVTNRGTRGQGVTMAGPLHSLMGKRLIDLDAPTVEAWAAEQGAARPTSARLAWRCLKAFLAWCAEQPQYRAFAPVASAKTKRTREALGKAAPKTEALLKEQMPAWFSAVRNISNPTIAAYLQVILLTGARPGEVLELRWEDINTRWRGLTMRDKVEGERVIPLTPYVSHLIHGLHRRNEWVFASSRLDAAGRPVDTITQPRKPHETACRVAGIDGLTLHGLRRSFKSLTEWLEIPAGVVAQIMGHKPSATAEKHYTVRPLDLLRVHHERIEAWMLEQAAVKFDATAEPGKLRAVS